MFFYYACCRLYYTLLYCKGVPGNKPNVCGEYEFTYKDQHEIIVSNLFTSSFCKIHFVIDCSLDYRYSHLILCWRLGYNQRRY